MQGCTGPALYAGVYRPYTIRRAEQALHYTQGCTAPELYPGLWRPTTIYAGLYCPCTICSCI